MAKTIHVGGGKAGNFTCTLGVAFDDAAASPKAWVTTSQQDVPATMASRCKASGTSLLREEAS